MKTVVEMADEAGFTIRYYGIPIITVEHSNGSWLGVDTKLERFAEIVRTDERWQIECKSQGVIMSNETGGSAFPFGNPTHGGDNGKPLTADDVRRVGGIVHGDGNIFFTNIEQLNAAIKEKT